MCVVDGSSKVKVEVKDCSRHQCVCVVDGSSKVKVEVKDCSCVCALLDGSIKVKVKVKEDVRLDRGSRFWPKYFFDGVSRSLQI